jgi:modulator of FtsH protease HflC
MKAVIILVAALVALLVLGGMFYTIPEYQQVIVTQFGKPVGRPVSTPGLKAKVPLIQQVHRFEKRVLEWDGDPNQLPTRDKRFIWVDTYARWRITDPLLFFQRLRDERGAQTRLDDILDGETRNAIAKYDVVEVVRSSNRAAAATEAEAMDENVLLPIVNGRGEIRAEILRSAQARTQDLGIEILDVQFKRINYVQDVQQKVYERMISERRRVADRFRSEGEGAASRIGGERERELLRIQSEAYQQAEEIKGRADAAAARIYAKAYNRNAESRELYEFLKTMESYPAVIDSSSQVILSTGADFYKYLKASK